MSAAKPALSRFEQAQPGSRRRRADGEEGRRPREEERRRRSQEGRCRLREGRCRLQEGRCRLQEGRCRSRKERSGARQGRCCSRKEGGGARQERRRIEEGQQIRPEQGPCSRRADRPRGGAGQGGARGGPGRGDHRGRRGRRGRCACAAPVGRDRGAGRAAQRRQEHAVQPARRQDARDRRTTSPASPATATTATSTSRGRRYTLIDTGGFDPESDDPMKQGIKRQIEPAIAEADVIVCVLDARVAAHPRRSRRARRCSAARSKPVIYVANKADSPRARGRGVRSLPPRDRAAHPGQRAPRPRHRRSRGRDRRARCPPSPRTPSRRADDAALRDRHRRQAQRRQVVARQPRRSARSACSSTPARARRAIRSTRCVERDGKRYLLIDTAGIRRKAQGHEGGRRRRGGRA